MALTAGQRLALSVALAVFVVSSLGMGLAYVMVERDLWQRQEALIAADRDGFAALYDQRRIPGVRQAIEFRLAEGTEGLTIAIWQRDGTLLAGNLTTWPPPDGIVLTESADPAVSRVTLNGAPHIAAAAVLPGGFPLVVARATAPVEATLARLRMIFAGALGLAAVVALAVGFFASRAILRRVARINALADEVGRGDLSARIETPAAPDEFGDLQRHFHSMLDRIEALYTATQYLSDSVAHEMRTPLTRIQTRLAQIDAAPADVEALDTDIRGTIRIFDAMLEIARAEADRGDTRDLSVLDLSVLLAEIADLYEPSAEAAGLTLITEIAPSVAILGDRNLVAQLVSNLVENALKYTPAGGQITLALVPGPRPILKVSDTGRGIPPGFEARIFDRFTRAAPDGGAEGFGLGLALVKAIALRHGATLTLPPVEKGFSLHIAWPNLSPD